MDLRFRNWTYIQTSFRLKNHHATTSSQARCVCRISTLIANLRSMKKSFWIFQNGGFFQIDYFFLAKQRFWKYQLTMWLDFKKSFFITWKVIFSFVSHRPKNRFVRAFSGEVRSKVNYKKENCWSIIFHCKRKGDSFYSTNNNTFLWNLWKPQKSQCIRCLKSGKVSKRGAFVWDIGIYLESF